MAKNICDKLVPALAAGEFRVQGMMTMSTMAQVAVHGTVKMDGKRVGFEMHSPPGDDPKDKYPQDHDLFMFYFPRGQCFIEKGGKVEPASGVLDPKKVEEARTKLLASAEKLISDHADRFKDLRAQSQFVATPQTPAFLRPLVDYFSVATVIGQLSLQREYYPDTATRPGESIKAHNERITKAWEDRATQDKLFGNVGIEYVVDNAKGLAYVAVYHHKDEKAAGKPPVFFAVFEFKRDKLGGRVLFVHNYNEDLKKHYIP